MSPSFAVPRSNAKAHPTILEKKIERKLSAREQNSKNFAPSFVGVTGCENFEKAFWDLGTKVVLLGYDKLDPTFFSAELDRLLAEQMPPTASSSEYFAIKSHMAEAVEFFSRGIYDAFDLPNTQEKLLVLQKLREYPPKNPQSMSVGAAEIASRLKAHVTAIKKQSAEIAFDACAKGDLAKTQKKPEEKYSVAKLVGSSDTPTHAAPKESELTPVQDLPSSDKPEPDSKIDFSSLDSSYGINPEQFADVMNMPLPSSDLKIDPVAANRRLKTWQNLLDKNGRHPEFKTLFVRRMAGTDDSLGARIDRCLPELIEGDSFFDRIVYFVDRHTARKESDPKTLIAWGKDISRRYGIQDKKEEVNLTSHKMCPADAKSLEMNLKGKYKIKGSPFAKLLPETVTEVQKFVSDYNKTFEAAKNSTAAKAILRLKWSKIEACLIKKESLGDADGRTSKELGRYYNDAGIYKRPDGVNITAPYKTVGGSRVPAGKVTNDTVIGLNQITPAGGDTNIFSDCVPAWNKFFARKASCQISDSVKNDTKALFSLLGSSQQTFNAFCGVSKIQNLFHVQVNSKDVGRTDPSNVLEDNKIFADKLKAPKDRCVSLFFGPDAYNHFGPLQNQSRHTVPVYKLVRDAKTGGRTSRKVGTKQVDDLMIVMRCINDT